MKRLTLFERKTKIEPKHRCPKFYAMPLPDDNPQDNDITVEAAGSFPKLEENILASNATSSCEQSQDKHAAAQQNQPIDTSTVPWANPANTNLPSLPNFLFYPPSSAMLPQFAPTDLHQIIPVSSQPQNNQQRNHVSISQNHGNLMAGQAPLPLLQNLSIPHFSHPINLQQMQFNPTLLQLMHQQMAFIQNYNVRLMPQPQLLIPPYQLHQPQLHCQLLTNVPDPPPAQATISPPLQVLAPYRNLLLQPTKNSIIQSPLAAQPCAGGPCDTSHAKPSGTKVSLMDTVSPISSVTNLERPAAALAPENTIGNMMRQIWLQTQSVVHPTNPDKRRTSIKFERSFVIMRYRLLEDLEDILHCHY